LKYKSITKTIPDFCRVNRLISEPNTKEYPMSTALFKEDASVTHFINIGAEKI